MTQLASNFELENHWDLRHKIEHAVVEHDARKALQLLSADTKIGLTVLGSGFGASISDVKRQSFATFCMANKANLLLESVLRSNLAGPGELLRLSCTWMHSRSAPNGSIEPPNENFQTLAYSAMTARNTAGTILAIEFESEMPKMRSVDSSHIRGTPMTYHAEALRFTMSDKGSDEFIFVGAANVCRTYLQNKLPAQRLTAGTTVPDNNALYEFVCASGTRHPTAFIALFRDYLAAGYFGDLNARLPNELELYPNVANKRPLTGAILNNNRYTAVELVLAGADVSGIGDDAGCPGMGIVDLVLSRWSTDSVEFAAALTHALMTRQLGAGAGLSPDQLAPESGRAPRRGVKGSV